MKPLLPAVVAALAFCGCTTKSTAEETAVYRAVGQIECSTDVGVSYEASSSRLQDVASAILVLNQTSNSGRQERMAGRYRTAFASFNDAATLWKASLESAGNEDLEDGYLDASGDLAGLVATHHVQTVSYGGRPDIQFHHTSLDTWTDAGRAGASAYSHYRGLDWMKNRNNANGTADRLVVSLAVSGYAPPPQIILRQAACIPSDYEPYVHPGTGVIEGQAFLRARDGDVKTGAGSWVKCNPATTYSREWFDVQVMQGIQLAQGNPAILAANNRVQCDAEGRFAIDQLPAGHYFLACTITWETVGSDFVGDPKLRRTGGTAYSEVDVEDGKTAKAILTR